MSLWSLELLRLARTHRWMIVFGVYGFFAITGPLMARYFNEIIARFGGDVTVIAPDPRPVDGLAFFLDNASQLGLLAVVVAGFPFTTDSDFFIRVGINTLLLVILAVGLNVVVGWAGLLDLGYIAFYGFGAYTSALLSSNQLGVHLPTLASVVVVVVASALLGLLLGLPSRRLLGDYLAITTLFFGQAFVELTLNLISSDRTVSHREARCLVECARKAILELFYPVENIPLSGRGAKGEALEGRVVAEDIVDPDTVALYSMEGDLNDATGAHNGALSGNASFEAGEPTCGNALRIPGGNQVQASKLLGITRATLRKRVEKFGIKQELSIS